MNRCDVEKVSSTWMVANFCLGMVHFSTAAQAKTNFDQTRTIICCARYGWNRLPKCSSYMETMCWRQDWHGSQRTHLHMLVSWFSTWQTFHLGLAWWLGQLLIAGTWTPQLSLPFIRLMSVRVHCMHKQCHCQDSNDSLGVQNSFFMKSCTCGVSGKSVAQQTIYPKMRIANANDNSF